MPESKLPLDELSGRISGNLPHFIQNIEKAANHYEVFKDLGISQENIGSAEGQKRLNIFHKFMRRELHPDMVNNRLKGGESPDEIEALRLKREEQFKKLQEAFEVLSEPAKRQRYERLLKTRVTTQIYSPSKTETNFAENPRLFEALVPLEQIEAVFRDFVKNKIGGASMETEGYSLQYLRDPKNGQQILSLSFPNEETALDFIQLLVDKKMINNPFGPRQEKNSQEEEAPTQSPRSLLPQLKPPLVA